MKKCPFCAEEIQDAAILCRYCGKDIGPASRVSVESKESPTESIESRYEALLTELRGAKPDEVRNYPLGANRRAHSIALAAADLEKHMETAGPFLAMQWVNGTDEKMREITTYPEHSWLVGVEKRDPDFPTYQEWISAVAYALVNTLTPGHEPVKFLDMVAVVEKMRKIVRRTRLVRGISLFGAVANIATMFSVNKLPKEGSEYWYWQVRAAAQLEAEAVLGLKVIQRAKVPG